MFDNVKVTNSTVVGYGKVGIMLGMGADPGISVTFKNCVSYYWGAYGTYYVSYGSSSYDAPIT